MLLLLRVRTRTMDTAAVPTARTGVPHPDTPVPPDPSPPLGTEAAPTRPEPRLSTGQARRRSKHSSIPSTLRGFLTFLPLPAEPTTGLQASHVRRRGARACSTISPCSEYRGATTPPCRRRLQSFIAPRQRTNLATIPSRPASQPASTSHP
jgi:hypothetical protein